MTRTPSSWSERDGLTGAPYSTFRSKVQSLTAYSFTCSARSSDGGIETRSDTDDQPRSGGLSAELRAPVFSRYTRPRAGGGGVGHLCGPGDRTQLRDPGPGVPV